MILNKSNKININADIGESFGHWIKGDDDKIIKIINSANIACGAHAGDSNIMKNTIDKCIINNVSIGAHPSFFDILGFGRRKLNLSSKEIENLVAYQVGALIGISQLSNARVTHIKPHGSLNNMACESSEISIAIIKGFKAINKNLILLAPYKSELFNQGQKHNVNVISEVFADRKYLSNFSLAPRSLNGSVIHDENVSLKQTLSMVNNEQIETIDGAKIKLKAESICFHGDKKSSINQAKLITTSLKKEGFKLVTLPEMLL